MSIRRSWLALGLVPAMLAVAIVLPFALYWGEIPSPMATHWGFDGAPDGSMNPGLILVLLAGFFGVVWLGAVRTAGRLSGEAPSFLAVLYGIGGLLAAVGWLSVLANRGAADWMRADTLGALPVALVVIAGVVAAMLGWVLGGGSAATQPSVPAPALGGVDPQLTIWAGRGSSRILTIVAGAVIVIGLATWSIATLLLVLIGALMLTFAEVRVIVAGGGVLVSHGWLGFPSWKIPLGEISAARVEDVRPMAYGGYGYRVRPGVRAIVMRGGPSLYLERRDKPDILFTVDDPITGAGLVNSMLEAEPLPS